MENFNLNKDILSYKIVLLGDSSVGKSCIMERYVNHNFDEYSEVTIGASFATKDILVKQNKIRFEMWDTAGQERYKSLTPMYYRNAMGAIVVYDITNKETLINAESWIKKIVKERGEKCKIILVGNKSDLEDKRKVDKKIDTQFENIKYIETSAKSGKNIEKIFKTLAEMLDMRNEKTKINISELKINKKNKCC